MTPDQVHFGWVDAVHVARQVALDRAFAEHPARFVNKAPVPFAKPTATWINRPVESRDRMPPQPQRAGRTECSIRRATCPRDGRRTAGGLQQSFLASFLRSTTLNTVNPLQRRSALRIKVSCPGVQSNFVDATRSCSVLNIAHQGSGNSTATTSGATAMVLRCGMRGVSRRFRSRLHFEPDVAHRHAIRLRDPDHARRAGKSCCEERAHRGYSTTGVKSPGYSATWRL